MFDSVIIGAGVAGCVAARNLAESGRKVPLPESWQRSRAKRFWYWKRNTISAATAMTRRMNMES